LKGFDSKPGFLFFGVSLALAPGCAREPSGSPATGSVAAPAPTSTVEGRGTLPKGSITADPNPIRVCDGSGLGVTSLSWTSTGARYLQVRVGAPNGALFAASGPSSGPVATRKWVADGTTFYLQDTTGDLPLASENTVSTVTVKVTKEGCP
jgi:hypothetical protein